MNFTELLDRERRHVFISSNGGIALPAAGAIYWLALGVAGFYLRPGLWMLVAFSASGLIFPLGLWLQKPLRANLMLKSPLAGLVGPALLSMMLSWPVTIAASGVHSSLAPLALAIGMSLHWPAIGWLFNCRVCHAHALVRVLVVTAIWYGFPAERFTAVPLAVALVYVLTVWGLIRSVTHIRQQHAPTILESTE
ncbi:DUF7010 family protein [Larkinella sp. VNQ87]|uniref:DUF7010 family protein n=1 Tax=Larkinella sp. VNQ87 TaxID=3400921 RepID=UPI003C0BB91E